MKVSDTSATGSAARPLSAPSGVNAVDIWDSPQHRRTVYGVLAIIGTCILFDGYDLVIYGAVLPTLLADSSHIGQLSPAVAGTLGSWALIGVLVGALGSGAVGDRLGRRKVMLTAIAWFSIGMAITAFATSITMFGFFRFFTGIGVGMIVATGGAVIAEFAPKERKNLFNAVVYSGVPAGGLMASALALMLEDTIGWRGLFLIGASPLLFLLPAAYFLLPESPRWLSMRGEKQKAIDTCQKFGLPAETFVLSDEAKAKLDASTEAVGFKGILSRKYLLATLLIGFMSFIGLLLTYGLNTWLPQIMKNNGANAQGSIIFLLILNGGAVVGGLFASWIADRIGPKVVVTTTFFLAAICLFVLTLKLPLIILYVAVAFAGVGVLGTQVLIYGLTSNHYGTEARAAGVSWCAGFGRIGGIIGPMIGGFLIGAAFSPATVFYIFAGIAVVGAVLTMLIPRSPAEIEEALAEQQAAELLEMETVGAR